MNTPNTAPTKASTKTIVPSTQPIRIPRVLTGRVTSTKMQKTVTIEVSRRVKHERYGKYINRNKKYHAHVEGITLNDGDMVEIQECRPYSATKTWRVMRKLGGVGGR